MWSKLLLCTFLLFPSCSIMAKMGGAAGGAGLGSAVGGPAGAAVGGGMGYLGAEAAVQTIENEELQQQILNNQALREYYHPMSALDKAWGWFRLTIAIVVALFVIAIVYTIKRKKCAEKWYAKIDEVVKKEKEKYHEEYKRQRRYLQPSAYKSEE